MFKDLKILYKTSWKLIGHQHNPIKTTYIRASQLSEYFSYKMTSFWAEYEIQDVTNKIHCNCVLGVSRLNSQLQIPCSHLEDVDVDIRHGEHRPAHEHTQQGPIRRREPGDIEEQPVLWIQAQGYHQDGPKDVGQRLSFELSCKTMRVCMRVNSHCSGTDK